MIIQYVENLGWYLIVDHDTTQLIQILSSRIYKNVIIFIFVVVIILYTITDVIRKYNARIIELTVLAEKEHRTVYQEAAEQLYEKIYEVDITHDRPADEAAVQYFVGLGFPPICLMVKCCKALQKSKLKKNTARDIWIRSPPKT